MASKETLDSKCVRFMGIDQVQKTPNNRGFLTDGAQGQSIFSLKAPKVTLLCSSSFLKHDCWGDSMGDKNCPSYKI
jgi:hypothetical protein